MAVGTNAQLDAQTAQFYVTAWRYASGLAMVSRTNYFNSYSYHEIRYEYLDEMPGFTRYEIRYVIRDDYDEGKLILAGYGLDEDGVMTGFMAKSYDDAISCDEDFPSSYCRS